MSSNVFEDKCMRVLIEAYDLNYSQLAVSLEAVDVFLNHHFGAGVKHLRVMLTGSVLQND